VLALAIMGTMPPRKPKSASHSTRARAHDGSASPLPEPRVPQAGNEGDHAFLEVVGLIRVARQKALRSVNTTLIELYWAIGAMISRKIEAAEWGSGVVDELAAFLARTEPGLRGFTRRNLFG